MADRGAAFEEVMAFRIGNGATGTSVGAVGYWDDRKVEFSAEGEGEEVVAKAKVRVSAG